MNQQQGYGLGGVFRSAGRYVNPILEEAGKITATVGADLAKNLLTDIIEGKDVKESARERGKEAGKQSLNLGTKRVIEKVQGPKVSPKATPKAKVTPKAVKRPRSQSEGPKKKKPRKSQKGGIFSYFIAKEATKRVMDHERKKKRKRKKSQKGGARSGSKKKSQKKAVGVVFPRAMTSKQRRSLPPKDIFG